MAELGSSAVDRPSAPGRIGGEGAGGVSRFGLLWLFDHPAIGKRILNLGTLFVAVFLVVVWVGWMLFLAGVFELPEDFVKIDFFSFYSSSALALKGEAAGAYDIMRLGAEQAKLPGDDSGVQPWRNPPVFFFVVLPLGLLPLVAAFALWTAGTTALLMTAIRRMTPNFGLMLIAFALPATFWNLLVGQTGMLVAGLFAWGMILLRDRPLLAGVVLGLLVVKPQFFPLAVVALLATRNKPALLGMAGCVGGLSLLSLGVFGVEAWDGFISLARISNAETYNGSAPLGKMQSPTALLLLLGVAPTLTQVLQGMVSLACAGFVFWLWRQDVAFEYKASGLAVATLLATPYSYHYDLSLLAPAIVWLVLRFKADGWRRWDAEVLLLAWLSPIAVIFAMITGVSAAAPVILGLCAIIARRVMPVRNRAEVEPERAVALPEGAA